MPGLEMTLLPLLFGYLFGSVPFGLVFARLFNLGDLRSIGSGNIGATNVLRTGNKKVAALTLLADALKGTFPVLVVSQFSELGGLLAGFGAFLGHLFPVWLKFKGGKGIATYVGVLLAFWWQGLVAFAVVWLAMAYLFRYSSLAALAATIAAPLAFWFAGRSDVAILFCVMSAIAWFMHRENIKRLLSGSESKIGNKG